MEYQTMEAGRKLDALVAERVMGLNVHADEDGPYLMDDWPSGEDWMSLPRYSTSLPRYSTDIAAAWEVVEKIWSGDILVHMAVGADLGVEVRIDRIHPIHGWETLVFLEAPTAPLAICRAALKAVEETDNE